MTTELVDMTIFATRSCARLYHARARTASVVNIFAGETARRPLSAGPVGFERRLFPIILLAFLTCAQRRAGASPRPPGRKRGAILGVIEGGRKPAL